MKEDWTEKVYRIVRGEDASNVREWERGKEGMIEAMTCPNPTMKTSSSPEQGCIASASRARGLRMLCLRVSAI